MQEACDVIVVGAGIVGLATAVEVAMRFPGKKVVVLEKEKSAARHQTGRNSGVIHSGVYYRPGSLKAKTCIAGARYLYEFCREHRLPARNTGKVIVATSGDELPRLEDLYRRGIANGIAGIEMITAEKLREIEPYSSGLRALWVPGTGIVDYVAVCAKFIEILRDRGGKVVFGARVEAIEAGNSGVRVFTPRGGWTCAQLVNCTGLFADRVAALTGTKADVKIVPFRGEYYRLRPARSHLVRGLIYPVPDPDFPFLGVHFTRMVDDSVTVGPNAVLALKREGYRKTSFSARDALDSLVYPGLWKLARRYWKNGVKEMERSFFKSLFVKSAQRLLPQLTAQDLIPHPAGVRAQALTRTGELSDDFCLQTSHRVLHVLNAPSPAATASIAIAKAIVDRMHSV